MLNSLLLEPGLFPVQRCVMRPFLVISMSKKLYTGILGGHGFESLTRFEGFVDSVSDGA